MITSASLQRLRASSYVTTGASSLSKALSLPGARRLTLYTSEAPAILATAKAVSEVPPVPKIKTFFSLMSIPA